MSTLTKIRIKVVLHLMMVLAILWVAIEIDSIIWAEANNVLIPNSTYYWGLISTFYLLVIWVIIDLLEPIARLIIAKDK